MKGAEIIADSASALRPTSYQVCAIKVTIQRVTGGADTVGFCRKPLFHRGAHDINATISPHGQRSPHV